MSEDTFQGIHLPRAFCIRLLTHPDEITFTPKFFKLYVLTTRSLCVQTNGL